jgi:hypothetical protein
MLPDTPMPERIAVLPRDDRGYPITYVTLMRDGKPDFKVTDFRKRQDAIMRRLCAICGQPLEYWMAFIGGPASCRSRVFFDPAMHVECAEYSSKVCPFLANPNRQYGNVKPSSETVQIISNHTAVAERSTQSAIFITRGFVPINNGGVLHVKANPPRETRWF